MMHFTVGADEAQNPVVPVPSPSFGLGMASGILSALTFQQNWQGAETIPTLLALSGLGGVFLFIPPQVQEWAVLFLAPIASYYIAPIAYASGPILKSIGRKIPKISKGTITSQRQR